MVVGEGGGGCQGLDETFHGAVGHAQVVEAGGEDEFVVEAADASGLGVEENALEVDDC